MAAYAGRQLAELTGNDVYGPVDRYKVWPTNEDREACRPLLTSA